MFFPWSKFTIFNLLISFDRGHLLLQLTGCYYYTVLREVDFQNVLCRYCECFASGIYCDGCNCANCFNNVDNEAARREAVEATLERNPNAFRPKIASSPQGARDSRVSRSNFLLQVVLYSKSYLC